MGALNTAGLVGPSTPEAPLIVPELPPEPAAPVPRQPPTMAPDRSLPNSGAKAGDSPPPPPPDPQMSGDPLAAYHPPGALARHQMRGMSGDGEDPAAASQLHSSQSPPRREVVDLDRDERSTLAQQRAGGTQTPEAFLASRHAAAASSSGSPGSHSSPGVRSGGTDSPGGVAAAQMRAGDAPLGKTVAQGRDITAAAVPSQAQAPLGVTRTVFDRQHPVYDPERAMGLTRTVVEATGRIVDPSEIKKTRAGSSDAREAAVVAPAEEAAPPVLLGGAEVGVAGSWALGQKGSLRAGPSH